MWCSVIVLNTFGSSQFPKIHFIVLRNTKQFVLPDELQESCLSKNVLCVLNEHIIVSQKLEKSTSVFQRIM